MLAEKGSFTWGAAAAKTITLADSRLTPKAILAWTLGPASEDTATVNIIFSMGFGSIRGGTVQDACIGIWSEGAVATTSCSRSLLTDKILVVQSDEVTADYKVDLTSFGAGQFVLTSDTPANSDGDVVHYVVWGGSEIADANVITATMNTSGTTQAFGTVGFQPDVVIALWNNTLADLVGVANASFTFGCATSATDMWAWGGTMDDGIAVAGSMDWNSKTVDDACLSGYTEGAGSLDGEWSLASFDSGGFTLNIDNAPATADTVGIFLCIKGGKWKAFADSRSDAVGTETVSWTSPTFVPVGILGVSRDLATHGSAISCILVLGASDGAREGTAVLFGRDGVLNTQSNRKHRTDKVFQFVNSGDTMPNEAEADMGSMTTAGSFGIGWTSNTGGETDFILYLVFGEPEGGSNPHAGI